MRLSYKLHYVLVDLSVRPSVYPCARKQSVNSLTKQENVANAKGTRDRGACVETQCEPT